jgi:arginyl-tRNA synthetase
MNIIEQALKNELKHAVNKAFALDLPLEDIIIEVPKLKEHGDYSTNLAMRLVKTLKGNPRALAQTLIDAIDFKAAGIKSAEIAGAGFINLKMDELFLSSMIGLILNADKDFGTSVQDHPLWYNIEYVSANPTGDLHPGHARGAAIGDSLTRIMSKAGYKVTREYYLNDAGNQINNMARSLQARYLQACGVDIAVPEDGYHGKDLIEIAANMTTEVGSGLRDMAMEDSLPIFRKYGLKAETDKLKEDLQKFRVEFDIWTSEQSLYDQGLVKQTLDTLIANGHTYTADGALFLKTTDYEDDKDRVMIKSDGSYTYILPDIAYHLNKKQRGYDKLVDLLGADHHGYIGRLQAAFQALGYQKDDLHVDIIQMARMIKDGEEFKLSKRTGKAVALKDLIDEAGVDALRYYFVSRASDTHMDLDLDMAAKQSSENPVYYAQYAHARMCSILRQGEVQIPETFDRITHEKEIELIKLMADFPQMITDAAESRAPHKVCLYIQKLATAFHAFYSECVVLKEEEPLRSQRLALVKATQITLRNALELIGVAALEKM